MGGRAISETPVDVPPMPYTDDEDAQDLIANLIDDAVVAGADPPLAGPADQLGGPLGRGCSAISSMAAWIRRWAEGSSFRSCRAAAGATSMR